MAKKDAVEKKQDEAVDTYVIPEDLDTEVTGFEGATEDDYKLALLLILQSNSPQVEQGTVPGAVSGMLMNSVTMELFDGGDGVKFQPCGRSVAYLEYVPRTQGGGFLGMHEPESTIVQEAKKRHQEEGGEFGKLKTAEGNELVHTFTMTGYLFKPNGGKTPISIPFASTKIKHYKGWLSQAREQCYPGSDKQIKLFGLLYRLTTYNDKNKKGNFKNIQIMFEGGTLNSAIINPQSSEYREGHEFAELLAQNKYQTNYASAGETAEGSSDSAPDTGTDSDAPAF